MPPAVGRDDRLRARHGVEQRRAEPLGDRAHHEQVEPLDTAENVDPESRQQDVFLEMVFAHQTFEVFAQFAFAEDHEPDIGQLLHDEMRGFDQMPLALVRHQRADIPDHRRVMRKKESFVNVDGRRGQHMLDVDALVDRHDIRLGNTVGDQHRADRVRRGNEAVDLPMFPS